MSITQIQPTAARPKLENFEEREMIRDASMKLSSRAFESVADVRTMAEQMRQTGELVLRMLAEKFARESVANTIIVAVADFFSLSHVEFVSSTRREAIATPRRIAMYLMRERTDMSLSQIANSVGRGDHTTARHGILSIKEEIEAGGDMAGWVQRIIEKLDQQQTPAVA